MPSSASMFHPRRRTFLVVRMVLRVRLGTVPANGEMNSLCPCTAKSNRGIPSATLGTMFHCGITVTVVPPSKRLDTGLPRSQDEKPARFLDLAGLFWKPGWLPAGLTQKLTSLSLEHDVPSSCGPGPSTSSAPALCLLESVGLDAGSPRRGGAWFSHPVSVADSGGLSAGPAPRSAAAWKRAARRALCRGGAGWELRPSLGEQLWFQRRCRDWGKCGQHCGKRQPQGTRGLTGCGRGPSRSIYRSCRRTASGRKEGHCPSPWASPGAPSVSSPSITFNTERGLASA